ncbi:AAA family ATPase, partial [Candidatus Poribacteria bacterium]|nr:AAA family ATPase [Candidatus Poribacteria bacterium]
MQKIRIPKETWLKSWRALLQEGAITQVSEDCYIVSARHVQILTEKQLPFEEVKGEQTFHRGRGMQIERRRLMQCPNCQHENREGAKFCEGCGTKLPQTCPNCGTEVRPQARFCDACGTQLTGAAASPTQVHVPKLEDLHAQLQSLIPDALAQKYLSAEREITGENRLITVLFADISGSTALSRTRSPEAMFQLMQDCFKDLVNIVAGYEGSISGFRGDGLLALYGAPILHENDPERAILAAIDMRDAMRKRGLEITVGINTALMTVGEIQTALHKEYTAYGTEINLAARLQQAAKGGQIFVGSGTYRQTRYAFDFGRIENLTLKGLGGGIVAYEVLGVKVHPEKVRGIEGLRARMIGREREFAELKEAADGWLAGSGQVVSIIGEAGIGKSRLVSELKTYLTSPPAPLLQGEGSKESPPSLAGKGAGGLGQKPTVLEGRCVSIGQPISYWPFLDILRTYFGLREADTEAEIARKVTDGVRGLFQTSEVSKTSEVYAEEFLPFIGRLMSIRFGNELDKRLDFATPDQIKHQTIMRLKDLFETLASRGRGIPSSIESRGKDSAPTMLILEDLHWADDLSLDLISLLMDSLATTPLMLLCVYRPEQEHRVWQLSSLAGRKCLDRYTEITLKQLSSHESRRLVEELLTIDNLPESVKGMILRKSEGNPFFIEEVIRSLIDRDLVYREGDRWKARAEISDIDVPDTIQSVVLSRVDRLQAEARYVLQCASVIGRLFKYRLLEHLAQHERDLDRHLSEFEARDLVYAERTVPELEYAFKHAFTQEATYQGILEQKRRAFHGQVAQGIERLYQERLEEYYEELAHHYSRSGDAEKAAEYLLKAGEQAKRSYANEPAIAQVYHGIGKLVEAEQAFEKAIALAKEMGCPSRQLVRLYNAMAFVYFWQSRFDEDIRYGEMGLELLGDDKECLEAALMNSHIADVNLNKGNTEKWREYNHKNMAFIKKLEYSGELLGPYSRIIYDIVYYDRDLEAAWGWAKELETRSGQHHDFGGLTWAWYRQGEIVQRKGDYRSALSLYQKGLEMAERIGANIGASWCHWGIGSLLFNLGNIEEVEKHTRLYLTISEQVGSLRDMAWAH